MSYLKTTAASLGYASPVGNATVAPSSFGVSRVAWLAFAILVTCLVIVHVFRRRRRYRHHHHYANFASTLMPHTESYMERMMTMTMGDAHHTHPPSLPPQSLERVGGFTPALRPIPASAAESIRAVTQALMKQFDVPGAIVSVRRANQPLVEFASGASMRHLNKQQDTSTPPPVALDFSFRIGSITKTMTATTIVLLAEQGAFSLDDRLAVWFPRYPNANLITLRHLLNMTSGLGNYGNASRFERIFTSDPLLHWSVTDLVRWGGDEKTIFTPGEGWDYCNTNYILLGCIIERTMKLPLHLAFERALFAPLRMNHTFLATDDQWRDQPHARGYGVFRAPEHGLEDCTDWNPMWAWSAGGVISNVSDMHRWAANLGKAHILNAAVSDGMSSNPLLDQSSTNAPPKRRPPFERNAYFYGLGVMFDEGWVYHNGSIPGFESICAYHPALELSVVMSINQTTLPKFNAKSSSVTHLFKRVAQILTSPPVHVQ